MVDTTLFEADFETAGKTFDDHFENVGSYAWATMTPALRQSSSSYNRMARDKYGERANMEILTYVEHSTTGFTSRVGVAVPDTVVETSSANTTYGVWFVNSNGTRQLYWHDGSTRQTTALNAFTPAVGTNPFWVRLRVEDGQVSLKVWLDSVSEPETWSYEANSTTLSGLWFPNGRTALFVDPPTTGGGRVSFDNVTVKNITSSLNTTVDITAGSPITSIAKDFSYAGWLASVDVDLDAPTVSTTANDLTVETQNITVTTMAPTEDFFVDASGFKSDEVISEVVVNTTSKRLIYLFNRPAGASEDGKNKVELSIPVAYGIGGYSEIWIAPIVNYNPENPYNSTLGDEVLFVANEGRVYQDLTELVDLDTLQGFMLYLKTDWLGSGKALVTSENAIQPLLRLSYEALTFGSIVDLDPATEITSAAHDQVVNVHTDDYITAASRIDVSSHDAEIDVVVQPDAEININGIYDTVQANDVAVSLPKVTDIDAADAVALVAYDVDSYASSGATVVLDESSAVTVKALDPFSIQGEPVLLNENEDPYFVSTMQTLRGTTPGISGGLSGWDSPSQIDPSLQFWFRFNERTGNVAKDRAISVREDGVTIDGQEVLGLSGVVVGRNDGPEGRHSFHFNGDAFVEQPGRWGADEIWYYPSSLEFTFRSERKTQFIMGGSDMRYGLSTNNAAPWELWLEDGVLVLRQYDFRGNINQSQTVRARTDLADGQWHHVVLQNSSQNAGSEGAAYASGTLFTFELYVDSRLELRRRTGAVAQGFPDFIGGHSGYYTGYPSAVPTAPLAKSHWFNGDMTEVIFRNGRTLTADEVAVQRDNMFGIVPVRFDPARARIKAEEIIVKGNKPRGLVLHFTPDQTLANRGAKFTIDNQAVFSSLDENRRTYESMETFNDINTRLGGVEFAFQGLGQKQGVFGAANGAGVIDFFHQPVYRSNWGADAAGQFRDPVTDNYRLLNLDTDINMEDFNTIIIVGYPTNDIEWSLYDTLDSQNQHPKIPMRKQMEDLLAQIKEQVVSHRKGLFINDPFSAIALGIIDKVDYVPQLLENVDEDRRLGAQTGIFDHQSASIDPFYGANPDTPYWERVSMDTKEGYTFAARYEDTHANIKQRVRTLVPGLTDRASWIKTTEIRWWNLNPMGTPPYQFSRHFEQRPAGLELGDEFYMAGGYWDTVWGEHQKNLERDYGWIATPVRSIKVGTAVTTFANTYFNGPQATGNFYQDHAVSIVVQPGDYWEGEKVTGKVYLNFTEAYTGYADGYDIDKIQRLGSMFPGEPETISVGDRITYPDGGSWTVGPEHTYYQFSTHFGSQMGTQITLPSTGGSGPDWGWSAGGKRGSGAFGSGGAYAMQWQWKSFVPLVDIETPSMAQRGLRWLVKDVDTAGNALINIDVVEPEIAVKANDVDVEVSVGVEAYATTARVTTHANDFENADAKNVIVGVSSGENVWVRAYDPATIIDLGSARAVSVDARDMEFDWVWVDTTNSVVLTLPRATLTLVMEDK